MSDLVVVGFQNETKADEVLTKLMSLQKEQLIDLEDAAVAIKDQQDKLRIKQAVNLAGMGALGGSMWGLLIGTLFLSPLFGAAVGAGSGAISGALTDIGIDDKFIKELGTTLSTGSSALFILVRKATPDKVIAELQPFQGRLLRTSLSKDDEAALQAALDKPAIRDALVNSQIS